MRLWMENFQTIKHHCIHCRRGGYFYFISFTFPFKPLFIFLIFLSMILLPFPLCCSHPLPSSLIHSFHFPSSPSPQFFYFSLSFLPPSLIGVQWWWVILRYEILGLNWWEETEEFALLHQPEGIMEQTGLSTDTANKVSHGFLLKCVWSY